jgi:hypothetical protein
MSGTSEPIPDPLVTLQRRLYGHAATGADPRVKTVNADGL